MKKKINVYIDMDGTIANLYEVNNWLEKLRSEERDLFNNLKPITTQERLLKIFPKKLYNVKILSMTPKNASEEYCEIVKQEKNIWLDKYFPQITERIYLKYGDNKNLKNSKNAILLDDNETIRKNFKGLALNPIEIL